TQAVGFDDVIVRAQLEADDAIDLVALRGDHDDGELAGQRVALEATADLDPGHVGQHQVEQHQIGAVLADGADRLAAVADQDRDVTRLPEVVGQNLLQVLLVFDDQDARHGRSGRFYHCPATGVGCPDGVGSISFRSGNKDVGG